MRISNRTSGSSDREKESEAVSESSLQQFSKLMETKSVNPDKFRQTEEQSQEKPVPDKVRNAMIEMVKNAFKATENLAQPSKPGQMDPKTSIPSLTQTFAQKSPTGEKGGLLDKPELAQPKQSLPQEQTPRELSLFASRDNNGAELSQLDTLQSKLPLPGDKPELSPPKNDEQFGQLKTETTVPEYAKSNPGAQPSSVLNNPDKTTSETSGDPKNPLQEAKPDSSGRKSVRLEGDQTQAKLETIRDPKVVSDKLRPKAEKQPKQEEPNKFESGQSKLDAKTETTPATQESLQTRLDNKTDPKPKPDMTNKSEPAQTKSENTPPEADTHTKTEPAQTNREHAQSKPESKQESRPKPDVTDKQEIAQSKSENTPPKSDASTKSGAAQPNHDGVQTNKPETPQTKSENTPPKADASTKSGAAQPNHDGMQTNKPENKADTHPKSEVTNKSEPAQIKPENTPPKADTHTKTEPAQTNREHAQSKPESKQESRPKPDGADKPETAQTKSENTPAKPDASTKSGPAQPNNDGVPTNKPENKADTHPKSEVTNKSEPAQTKLDNTPPKADTHTKTEPAQTNREPAHPKAENKSESQPKPDVAIKPETAQTKSESMLPKTDASTKSGPAQPNHDAVQANKPESKTDTHPKSEETNKSEPVQTKPENTPPKAAPHAKTEPPQPNPENKTDAPAKSDTQSKSEPRKVDHTRPPQTPAHADIDGQSKHQSQEKAGLHQDRSASRQHVTGPSEHHVSMLKNGDKPGQVPEPIGKPGAQQSYQNSAERPSSVIKAGGPDAEAVTPHKAPVAGPHQVSQDADKAGLSSERAIKSQQAPHSKTAPIDANVLQANSKASPKRSEGGVHSKVETGKPELHAGEFQRLGSPLANKVTSKGSASSDHQERREKPSAPQKNKDKTEQPQERREGQVENFQVQPAQQKQSRDPVANTSATETSKVSTQEKVAEMQKIVDQIVSRVLVSKPGSGQPEELRLMLSSGPLKGTEIAIMRKHGDIQLSFNTPNPETQAFLVSLKGEMSTSLRSKLPNERFEVRIQESKKASPYGKAPVRRAKGQQQ
ncbi:hypothetical protein [Hahella sp. HN01]|uniref:hypothetical protein n=1 Tax=Hahella sp. HN01 TaxID=2847262 RepID=UPI001C1EB89D|nr:hypothetical protein [Hahella sp. HN01]MBU6949811.1 hypothetical protein [Hahella sp. HN01]